MQPVVTHQVAWSVCLSVCHSREPCKNGWTYRDAVWILNSGGPKEPCVTWQAHWRNLANTIVPSACGGDAALFQIILTTCLLFLVHVCLFSWFYQFCFQPKKQHFPPVTLNTYKLDLNRKLNHRVKYLREMSFLFRTHTYTADQLH